MNLIRKNILILLTVASFASFMLFQSSAKGIAPLAVVPTIPVEKPAVLPVADKPKSVPTITPPKAENPIPKPTPAPTPVPTPVILGKYKDGTYQGDITDAYYGDMQVGIVVAQGYLNKRSY